jgi:ribosomal protein S18 acetylase RimI-like enzyme
MTTCDEADATIEPGRPEDAAAASRLLFETDPVLFGLYGSGDRDLWREVAGWEWRSETGIYSHTMSHVARVGGEVVGLLVSYTPRRDALTDWSLGASRAHIDPGRWRRMEEVRSLSAFLFPAIPGDAYYVQNVVTDQGVRRRGLGRRLMELAFGLGREEGCRACHLDVGSDNPAVQFYRNLGMSVEVETAVPALMRHGIPRHYRMVVSLESAGPREA